MATTDRGILEAALIGYGSQVEKLRSAIADIRKQLKGAGGGTGPMLWKGTTTDVAPGHKKRTMSAAARKRIAAAQKKRWAEFHAKKAS